MASTNNNRTVHNCKYCKLKANCSCDTLDIITATQYQDVFWVIEKTVITAHRHYRQCPWYEMAVKKARNQGCKKA